MGCRLVFGRREAAMLPIGLLAGAIWNVFENEVAVASHNSPGIRLHQNFGGIVMHHQFSSRITDMMEWDQTLLWMSFNRETSHKRSLSHTQHAAKRMGGLPIGPREE